MNWPLFVSTFSLIFVAELPDKTALATLMLATRGRPGPVFSGVALAFLIQSVVAVAFGSLIGMLPARWVRIGAGVLFLGFAAHTWFFHRGENEVGKEATRLTAGGLSFLKDAWSAFIVIFIAEWGDLTQLATASMAAHYRESLVTIFIAAVSALWCVAAIAIFLGNSMTSMLEGRWLRYLGTLVFAAVGSYFLAMALWPGLIG